MAVSLCSCTVRPCGPNACSPAATTVTLNSRAPFPHQPRHLERPPFLPPITAETQLTAVRRPAPPHLPTVPAHVPGQVAQRIRQLPGLRLGPLRDVTVNWRHGGFLRLDPHVDPAVRVHRSYVATLDNMLKVPVNTLI